MTMRIHATPHIRTKYVEPCHKPKTLVDRAMANLEASCHMYLVCANVSTMIVKQTAARWLIPMGEYMDKHISGV